MPANRWGHATFTVVQLKVMQEAIGLSVFLLFGFLWLKETVAWNHLAAFVLLFAAVWLAFLPAPAGLTD